MKTTLLAMAVAMFAFTTAHSAVPTGWTDDYSKAVEKAKAEKKNILLDFTGSDWCGYCMALDKEVFASAKFKSWAKENVVLVKVDFPKTIKQSAKLKEQNSGLKNKYPFSGYPTVVIIDPEGNVISKKSGYNPGSGPAAYLQGLAAPSKK